MTRVELSPQSRLQVERVDEWWRANRPAAPHLFANELSLALRRLARSPSCGAVHSWSGSFDVRKVLLRRTRYHIFYSIDAKRSVVEIHALWHASRGRGPSFL